MTFVKFDRADLMQTLLIFFVKGSTSYLAGPANRGRVCTEAFRHYPATSYAI